METNIPCELNSNIRTLFTNNFFLPNFDSLDDEVFLDKYRFIGSNRQLFILGGATSQLNGSSFENISLIGRIDTAQYTRCNIGATTNVGGNFIECLMGGQATLASAMNVYNSYSQDELFKILPGSEKFTLSNHQGTVTITGMTSSVSKIDVSGGRVIVDATCTGGTLTVIGKPYEIVDNSAGVTIIDQTGDIKTGDIHNANFRRRAHDNVLDTVTIYW